MRKARAMSRPSVDGAAAVHDSLVTGLAISAWGISCIAPRPRSRRDEAPLSTITGDSDIRATYIALSAFAKPGPAVTNATPGDPVSRPQGVGHVYRGGLVAHVYYADA